MNTYIRNADRLTVFLFIALVVVSIAGAIWLPDPIAVHYNLAGKPNRWGSSTTLLILPGIAFILLSILWAAGNAHPDFMNFPGPRNPENIARQLRNTHQLLASMRAFLMGLFLLLQAQGIWATIYNQDRLIGWILPFLLACLFLLIGFFIRRSYKLIPR